MLCTNIKKEHEYFEALKKETFPVERGVYLSEDDLLRRHVITKVMCDFELDFTSVEKQFNIEFKKYFSIALEDLMNLLMTDL